MRVVPRESSSHFPRPDRATQLINFPPNSPQIFTAARTELCSWSSPDLDQDYGYPCSCKSLRSWLHGRPVPAGAPSPGPTSDKLVCRGYLIRLECYNTYVPIYTPQSVKCLGTYLPKRLISIRVLYSSRSNTYRIRVNVRGKLWKLLKRDCHAVEHGDSRVTLDDWQRGISFLLDKAIWKRRVPREHEI